MALFNSKFNQGYIYTEIVDDTRHPLFEEVKPLTPHQMLLRVANGQPISCSKPNSERIMFNNRFFDMEKLDVIDTLRLQQKELAKRFNRPQSVGAETPLSSSAPGDTNDENLDPKRSGGS